jgi:proteasome accessory factor C
VGFDYLTGGTGSTERRTVQPHELFSHRGQWYLAAWDKGRGDDRLFRLDRIASAQLLDAAFEAKAPLGRTVPSGEDAKAQVKVRFSPAAAPYARERFGAAARWLANGALEVEVPGDSARWLTGWVLSFGGEAVVVEPAWAVKAVAEAARASLDS